MRINDWDYIILSIMEYSDAHGHFLRWNRAFRVESINNNGTIKARDRSGHVLWTHE